MKGNKKILVVSGFYYPELVPRAFRTYELVIGFCNKGYFVDLVLPNKEVYKNNRSTLKGLNIIYSNEPIQKEITPIKNNHYKHSNKVNILPMFIVFLKKIYFYIFPREVFHTYNKGITEVLVKNNNNYDVVISISQPLGIHLSVTIAKLFYHKFKNTILIAEFSDPMFKGDFLSVFPSNWSLGYLFSWCFTFFVVPIKQAVPTFQVFKKKNKIKVIPQGFDLTKFKISKYSKNKTITFSYAGSFYRDLRDPKYFFEALTEIRKKFVFKLYIPRDPYFYSLIENYKDKIIGEIILSDFIPREKLILELSTNDFLVNFSNENEKMQPSKLIDYAITKRPILSFNSKSFDINNLKDFLNYNYNSKLEIKLENYDIKTVIQNFEKIF